MRELVCEPAGRRGGLGISIIVPVYNGGEAFRSCLEAIKAADPPADEVIVVADGDTDGSGALAEHSGAKVIRLPSSRGPAVARNIGAASAGGDILVFVDADVTIPPGFVGKVIDAFRERPDISAVIGSYDDAPAVPDFFSQYKNLFHHYTHQHAREEASTFWGACGAVRREAFFSIGGFNEGYRNPSIEDIEVGYRLRKAGHGIRLLKDLQVKHLKRWSMLSLLKTDFFHRAIPWSELILREGKFLNDLNVTVSNRLSVIMVYLLVAAVLAMPFVSGLSPFALLLVSTLLAVNFDLYRFFTARHGLWFCARAVLCHWLYFFYSGMAFLIGFVNCRIRN